MSQTKKGQFECPSTPLITGSV